MDEHENLSRQFEANRSHLRAVAYRMLGSTAEAEDAVQEAWLRFSRADTDEVVNMGGWLTTIVSRVCLDMLRSRRAKREAALDMVIDVHVPDPVVGSIDLPDPESEAVLADSVGLALLVVLETLPPAERLAFVLHDMFAMPYEEIAPIVGRSYDATRQLASRARRRVRGADTSGRIDRDRQRKVVEAFMAASRGGDFDALVAVLDPDVVLRVDFGVAPAGARTVVRGAEEVAAQARTFRRYAPYGRLALVNGVAGVVTIPEDGVPVSILGFTVVDGRITEIDILADRDRLAGIDVSALGD